MEIIENQPEGSLINDSLSHNSPIKEAGAIEGKRPSPGRDKNFVKKHYDQDFYYPPIGEN